VRADRQFLMHARDDGAGYGASLDLDVVVSAALGSARVDFEALPVGEAGPGFPFVMVDTEAGPLELRVPTGSDEVAIGAVGAARPSAPSCGAARARRAP